MNPCPQCGEKRQALEAACTVCGWSPPALNSPDSVKREDAFQRRPEELTWRSFRPVVAWLFVFTAASPFWLANITLPESRWQLLLQTLLLAILGATLYTVSLAFNYFRSVALDTNSSELNVITALVHMLTGTVSTNTHVLPTFIHVLFWMLAFLSAVVSLTSLGLV